MSWFKYFMVMNHSQFDGGDIFIADILGKSLWALEATRWNILPA
jgi:hypothetical protein